MPKQIEELAKEADELHRKMYPDQYPKEDGDDSAPPSDEQKEKDGKTESDQDGQTDGQAAPASEDTGTPSGDDSGPTTQKQEHDQEDFKQKYFVLKGKYDAEVPRLHGDLGALRQVVSDLQTQIKELVSANTGDKKTTETDEDETVAFVEREYPEIYAAMVKLSEKKSGKATQADENALLRRIEAVEQVAVESAEDRFFRDLSAVAPDWKTHKDDPRFLEWLRQEDPLTGYSRLALAKQAQDALDGKRVGKFYSAFIKEVVGEKQAGENTGTEKSKQKDVSKFVAPPVAGGKGTAGKTSGDDIIKTSDIQKFYDDAQRGRYRGREAEYARMEAKIDKAVSEGKVIKG